ncbi:MAG: 4a-hydroxytetrahydrobiopterin dehydratase [Puniceicoccaceae bacterium 5H]|nr:MAG: 4a-hydroxytetrahydrobiopterin dehydratase [Puniceicoccaceae bacterium 5H]
MSHPLSAQELEVALSSLPGWSIEEDHLTKLYILGTFREAIGFIVQVGFLADEANHHPELYNVYRRVQVSLTTHDAGSQVTEKDVKLAEKIEALYPTEPDEEAPAD